MAIVARVPNGTLITAFNPSPVNDAYYPTHAEGDFIIVFAGSRKTLEPTLTIVNSTTGGYVSRGSIFSDLAAIADQKVQLFHKFEEAAEDTVISVLSTPNGSTQIGILGFTGVHLITPWGLAKSSKGKNAAAAEFTPPSVTTVGANSMVLSFAASSDNNAINMKVGSEQGFTLLKVGDWISGEDGCVSIAHKIVATPSVVTLPTWEQTAFGNDSWIYFTDALHDAAEAALEFPSLPAIKSPIGAMVGLGKMMDIS